MSFALKTSKQNKNNSREFQVVASVSALRLECRKNVWHPHKIVIVWDKDDSKKLTKPIPWEPGSNNPFHGILVWHETDHVKLRTTLYKDPTRSGKYKDYSWNFAIKNETKRGRHKVIATGTINLADYISKRFKAFNLTVTLKPSNKNIISASMKFSLSSVMLQDGVPFITKEDLIREILHDAEKSAADKKTEKIRIENANKTVPAVNSADVNNSAELPQPSSKQELSAAKESSSDARKINKNNNNNDSREEKKTAGDGKQPSLPNLPTAEEQQTHMMADSATEECDINGAKESSAQKNNEEKTSVQNKQNKDNSLPAGRNGRKEKNKEKKPKEDTSPSGSRDKKRNVSATETGLPCNAKSGEAFEGMETSDVEGKRNDGDEKIVLSSSKTKTSCPGQSGAEGGSGEKLSSSDSSGTSVQTVVDKTKRIKSEANVKNTVNGSEEVVSSVPGQQTNSGDKEDEATANGTQEPPAKDLNAVEKEKQRLACFFDKLRKPAPCKGSSGGGQIVGNVRCQTKIQVSGHNSEVAGEIKKDATATAAGKVPPTNGDAEEKEKQKLACFFNKLLNSAPHKAPETVCCPQLSEYVAEEMTLLKKEIVSLDKVTLKLEQEIRQAMDIADCSEELHSLTQDWFIMVDYRAELVSRRNNFQILDKQEDVEQCCNIMRSELKLLFTLEDWRKTAYHKAQQAKLLDLLFTFVNMRREK